LYENLENRNERTPQRTFEQQKADADERETGVQKKKKNAKAKCVFKGLFTKWRCENLSFSVLKKAVVSLSDLETEQMKRRETSINEDV